MRAKRKKPVPRPRRRRRRNPRFGPSLEERFFGAGLGFLVRAYRIEGRAATGFDAAKIVAAAENYGKAEIVAFAARFGLRFPACARKEEILRTFRAALRIAPEFDSTGRLVAPRFVYRVAERKFIRKDGDRAEFVAETLRVAERKFIRKDGRGAEFVAETLRVAERKFIRKDGDRAAPAPSRRANSASAAKEEKER